MNERIQELAVQAEKTHTYKDFSPDGYEVTKQEKTVDLEKFAELIVKECAKVLTQHGTYFSGEGEPYHYAASLIEEHFGVEE